MHLRSVTGLLLSSVLVCLPGCPGPDVPADGGLDAETDAPHCTLASECDDHRFCNGEEACVEGACVPGALPDCDDGVACTTDRCSEGRGRCEHAGPDEDGDGHGDPSCAGGDDCDDRDGARFPGNFELCDAAGHDEDCDPLTLGGIDEDGDGFVSIACCNGTACGADCDDVRVTSHPGGVEVCNTLDDDCDGGFDEELSVPGFVDDDADGFGGATAATACVGAPSFAVEGGDCDDADPTRSPGLVEVCNVRDDDCDPNVDEDAVAVDWFLDGDGDGFGARGSEPVSSCAPVTGRARNDRDCNDGAPAVSPRATEACNGIDDDCDGSPDYAIAPGDLEDDDGDHALDRGCAGGTDCDDRSASIGSGDTETCDGRDNDCDTRIDEGAATAVFFPDGDGDGFGDDGGGAAIGCTPPVGYVPRGGDCDDGDPARRPGGDETCDARDGDCDGAIDEDVTCPLGGTCTFGACRGAMCKYPMDDCDHDGTCETDVASAREHCGACGVLCAAIGTTAAACIDAGCSLDCMAGRVDCDRDPRTGCEATVATDPTNCGACGRRCDPRTGDGTTCMAGACTITSCRAGHLDCNGRADDGCETAAATCPVCGPLEADCDGDGVCNDLGESALHCGACGRACPADCTGGVCARIVEVDVGNGISCGRYETGQLVCWGGYAGGVRGPVAVDDGVPVVLAAPSDVVQLALGDWTACAVRLGGQVVCWGENDEGQLGVPTGTLAGSDVPVPIALPLPAVEVGVGRHFACALLTDGMPWCWGTNWRTAIDGTSSADAVLPPTAVALYAEGPPRVSHLAVGEHAICGAAGSTVHCTGGDPNDLVYPAGEGSFYAFQAEILDLSVGGVVACARLISGIAQCFGSNAGNGALGDGTTATGSWSPVHATELGGFVYDVSVMQWTTCAVDAFGTLRCTGDNQYAMTGDASNTTNAALFATPVSGLGPSPVLARTGNASHACAVDSTGTVRCWGVNSSGECGAPGSPFQRAPVIVEGL